MDIQDLFNKAYNISIDYLSLMPRTRYEVHMKLKRYLSKVQLHQDGIPIEDLIDSVLAKLEKENLINDSDYTLNYITQRINSSKPKSKPEIVKFLLRKGIDRDIIEGSLVQYTSDVERRFIKETLDKKSLTDSRKAKKYLYRRGFDAYLVNEVISDHLTP